MSGRGVGTPYWFK